MFAILEQHPLKTGNKITQQNECLHALRIQEARPLKTGNDARILRGTLICASVGSVVLCYAMNDSQLNFLANLISTFQEAEEPIATTWSMGLRKPLKSV